MDATAGTMVVAADADVVITTDAAAEIPSVRVSARDTGRDIMTHCGTVAAAEVAVAVVVTVAAVALAVAAAAVVTVAAVVIVTADAAVLAVAAVVLIADVEAVIRLPSHIIPA